MVQVNAPPAVGAAQPYLDDGFNSAGPGNAENNKYMPNNDAMPAPTPQPQQTKPYSKVDGCACEQPDNSSLLWGLGLLAIGGAIGYASSK